jgi:citrate synthase
MSSPDTPSTSLATSTVDDVFIRDKSLCHELIGKLTFTEMAYFLILGNLPSPPQREMVDACFVTLMEHGLTPSALTTRLTYSSAPEALQAAVAGGLLGVGSVFAGTMEGCGALLTRLVSSEAGVDEEALEVAKEHRQAKKPIAGFGHPQHKPDDPRASKLLQLADEKGVSGKHVTALLALSKAVDGVYGKHITINATGAIAAVLADVGVPQQIMRGFALISRCAGLVAHAHEEQKHPSMKAIWQAAEAAVPYDGAANR